MVVDNAVINVFENQNSVTTVLVPMQISQLTRSYILWYLMNLAQKMPAYSSLIPTPAC